MELLLVFFKVDEAHFGGHAEFGDHGCGHAGDFVEVVGRARGHGVEVDFLGDAATQRHGHSVHELVEREEVVFRVGEHLGVPEGLAAGDDGDFEKGVGVFEEPAADGVAGFVVRDCSFLFGIEDTGLVL